MYVFLHVEISSEVILEGIEVVGGDVLFVLRDLTA
jgi:hypothetical protein